MAKALILKSQVQDYEKINVCCFKPVNLWYFVMQPWEIVFLKPATTWKEENTIQNDLGNKNFKHKILTENQDKFH